MDKLISQQAAIDALNEQIEQCNKALSAFGISLKDEYAIKVERASLEAYKEQLENLPSVQPDLGKYEYHYDHTDCIWYRPEARNRCPVTCAQYRDGWNDAMNYIFRDGKGYRPYRRGEQYEE